MARKKTGKKKEFRQAFFSFTEPKARRKKTKHGFSLETQAKIDQAVKEVSTLSTEEAVAAVRKFQLRGPEIYPALRGLRYGERFMGPALADFRAWRRRKNEVKAGDVEEILAWLKAQDMDQIHARLIDFKKAEKRPTKKELLQFLSHLESERAREIAADAERLWRQSVSKKK
jgi:hypothetical protein